MSDVEKHAGIPNGAQPYTPRPSSIANPGALGLFSFASTTFILSLFNLSARNIHAPNAVVGMAIFTGGLVQLLAGMWEFPRGNVLGGTAFSSYGSFWMSYAAIQIPGTGIIAAYEGNIKELQSAIGIYLITWMMVTFLFLLASLKKNVAFIALFGFLTLTFMMLAIGAFSDSTSATKAGGALGIVTAAVAFYTGTSELLGKDSLFSIPLGKIPGA